MYLAYYTITKMVYREFPSFRPLAFVILAVFFWIAAIYFYTRVSDIWTAGVCMYRQSKDIRFVGV